MMFDLLSETFPVKFFFKTTVYFGTFRGSQSIFVLIPNKTV